MPRSYGYGGGDYSQAGQGYAQFAPRRRTFQSQEQQATEQALAGPAQYTPPTGGINPGGAYSGGTTAPKPASTSGGTTAADQLTQQATQNALAPKQPTLDELMQTTQVRGGGTGLERGVSTAAQIGSAALGVPSVAAGLGLGAWGGPIGMGIGAGISALMGDRAQHKQNIANDVTSQDARQLVAAAYRQYLGRDATPQEIDSHLRNQGGSVSSWLNPNIYGNALTSIQSSPEAQAYAARQAASTASASPSASTTTPSATTAPSSSSWNTDGFSAPAYTAQKPGSVMSGWDQGKWGDANHQTPKYVVGRILSQYAPTVEGLGQAVAEIQKAYPNATFDGKDKVTIPGVGTIDVLTGASVGGTGWAWQPLTNPDGSPVAGASSPSGSSGGPAGPIDTSWAYGGAIDTTRTLIQKLMQELGVAGALR